LYFTAQTVVLDYFLSCFAVKETQLTTTRNAMHVDSIRFEI